MVHNSGNAMDLRSLDVSLLATGEASIWSRIVAHPDGLRCLLQLRSVLLFGYCVAIPRHNTDAVLLAIKQKHVVGFAVRFLPYTLFNSKGEGTMYSSIILPRCDIFLRGDRHVMGAQQRGGF